MEETDKSVLSNLNDLCLDRVFHFCDVESCVALSETCVRLRERAERRFRKYTLLYIEISTLQSLKRAVKLITHVGNNITELELEFDVKPEKNDLTSIILRKFFKYVVDRIPQIRNFYLAGSQLCSMPEIYVLCPLFHQLENLNICHFCDDHPEQGDCFYTMDLPALCPILRVLHISGSIKFIPNPVKSFSSLLELSVWGDRYNTDISWPRLIREHRNLKKLELHDDIIIAYDPPCIDINDVVQYLVNLEEFSISVRIIRNLKELGKLSQLEMLRTLKLSKIAAHHVHMIATNLPIMKQLSQILIHSTGPIDHLFQQLMINLAVELPNLKIFETGFVKWEMKTLTDFIFYSGKLEVLTINANWDYSLTSELLWKLVDARRRGMQDQPLKLNFGWTSFEQCNADFLKVSKEPAAKRFIVLEQK